MLLPRGDNDVILKLIPFGLANFAAPEGEKLKTIMSAYHDPNPSVEKKGMAVPAWVRKLQKRWNVSVAQVFIILLVFACTGFTIMFLKRPIVGFFTGGGEPTLLFSVLYYLLILPVYNLFLLFYGFIFGQFEFFWAFEKRMFRRMTGRKTKEE